MRDQYWSMLQQKHYLLIYYQKYYNRVSLACRVADIFFSLVSCGCIAAWAIWKTAPTLLAVIICASQAYTVASPYLPYRKRVIALSMMLPQCRMLIDAIDSDWRLHNADPDCDYTQLIAGHIQAWTRLENQFLGPEEIPDRKYMRKKYGPVWEEELKREFFTEGR